MQNIILENEEFLMYQDLVSLELQAQKKTGKYIDDELITSLETVTNLFSTILAEGIEAEVELELDEELENAFEMVNTRLKYVYAKDDMANSKRIDKILAKTDKFDLEDTKSTVIVNFEIEDDAYPALVSITTNKYDNCSSFKLICRVEEEILNAGAKVNRFY